MAEIPAQSPGKASTDGSVQMAETLQDSKAEGMVKEHQSADANLLASTKTSQEIPVQSSGKTSTDGSVVIEAEVPQLEKSECMRKELSQFADEIQLAGTITSQELQLASAEFKKSKYKTSFNPK